MRIRFEKKKSMELSLDNISLSKKNWKINILGIYFIQFETNNVIITEKVSIK